MNQVQYVVEQFKSMSKENLYLLGCTMKIEKKGKKMEQKINFNSNGPFSLPRHVHIASSVRVSGKAGAVGVFANFFIRSRVQKFGHINAEVCKI